MVLAWGLGLSGSVLPKPTVPIYLSKWLWRLGDGSSCCARGLHLSPGCCCAMAYTCRVGLPLPRAPLRPCLQGLSPCTQGARTCTDHRVDALSCTGKVGASLDPDAERFIVASGPSSLDRRVPVSLSVELSRPLLSFLRRGLAFFCCFCMSSATVRDTVLFLECGVQDRSPGVRDRGARCRLCWRRHRKPL